jgi:hypothetical protein
MRSQPVSIAAALAATVLLSLSFAPVAYPQSSAAPAAADVTEPRSGVKFPSRAGDLVLTGVGLRTKTFLKVKVYAIGMYIPESAASSLVAAHKSDMGSKAFYRDLREGAFVKQMSIQFVRDLSPDQIHDAYREALHGADPKMIDLFASYFGSLTSGQSAVLRFTPASGGTLETTVAGLGKPPIADPAFVSRVLSIWLGDSPIQEDIKKGLVSLLGNRS